MKLKLTTFSLILIGLTSIACRQGESLIEDEQLSLHQEENQMSAKDSTSASPGFENNDPPKNGTHWKTASDEDTIKVINPKNFVGGLLDPNSSIGAVIGDDEPKDPPKNGTHWRAR